MGSPNIVKCLLQFDDGKFGWREEYYTSGAGNLVQGSATKVDMTQMLPVFMPLIKARAKMLADRTNSSGCAGIGKYAGSCNGPVLTLVRLSQVDALRNSLLFNPLSGDVIARGDQSLSLSQAGLNSAGIGSPADNPYSAVEMLMSLENGLTTKRALSGVPDATICNQAWSKSNTSWYRKWKEFAKYLTAGIFGTVSSSLGANGFTLDTAGGTNIESITVATDCTLQVMPGTLASLVDAGKGFCPTHRFQIFCYKSKPGYVNLNGIHRGTIVTPTSGPPYVSLQYSGPCPQYIDPGYIRVYDGPTFVKFIAASLGSVMNKKRGGPFDRRRARRRPIR